jgi:hypothetical protein
MAKVPTADDKASGDAAIIRAVWKYLTEDGASEELVATLAKAGFCGS